MERSGLAIPVIIDGGDPVLSELGNRIEELIGVFTSAMTDVLPAHTVLRIL